MSNRGYWVKVKKPIKLTKKEKEDLIDAVKSEIEKTSKLKEDISRINIRAGRIYFYSERELKGDGPYIDGLKKGDFVEDVYGRITVFKEDYSDCTLDWQRHNDRWMEMSKGSLEKCIKDAEEDSFFQVIDY